MQYKNVLVSISGDENRYDHPFVNSRIRVSTYLLLNIPLNFCQNRELEIICIPDEFDKKLLEDEYLIRRNAIDFSVPLLTKLFVEALAKKSLNELEIRHWAEYVKCV